MLDDLFYLINTLEINKTISVLNRDLMNEIIIKLAEEYDNDN